MIRRLKNRRCSRSGRCAAQRKYAEAYWSMTEDARFNEILGFDFSHLMDRELNKTRKFCEELSLIFYDRRRLGQSALAELSYQPEL